jgi:hypothetical protein
MAFDRGHALVIGVGTYSTTPDLSVPITAEDARQVAQMLVDPRTCAYPQQQVHLLTDGDASRKNILDALDALASNTSEDDTVLVFYSGHGMFGADGYYLTTSDTALDNRKVVSGTAVREAELLERLNRITAKRALLIFNACHSGAIAPGSLSGEQPTGAPVPDELATALLGTGAGRVVITACKEEQYSYYDYDNPTTYFAQAVVDALQGRGVTSRRGYIGVFDLYDYVYHNVNSEVRRRWKREQEPVLTVHQGVGVMAVALYRGRVPEGEIEASDRPQQLGGASREVTPEASQAALQQIVSGERNLAAGRDISGNTIIGGNQNSAGRDQYNASRDINTGDQTTTGDISGSSGVAIGRGAQSSVRNVNTGGGEYAEGNIDKRSGAFIEGGTVYGSVVGTNEGTITSNYGASPTGAQEGQVTLRSARQRVRQVVDEAHTRGDQGLAEELDSMEQLLGAASQAERAGDTAQRGRKLRQAKEDLNDLAGNRADLRALVELLARL